MLAIILVQALLLTGEEMQAKDPKKVDAALARSKALDSETRSKIASKAALKRHGYASATHTGGLMIAGAMVPCAVLEDGRRVLWQREVVGLLTGNKKGGLTRYLSAANLIPFAPDKFKDRDLDDSAIIFELDGRKAHGFEAEDLVDICKMYLNARKANALLYNQIHLADKAEIIVTSLAKVGITALIDEATGYQEVRNREALQALLDMYIKKELAAWAKRFPDEFYKEIFRLRKWNWAPDQIRRPGVVGKYTIDIVYDRLAPGIVEELEKINPKTDKGYRKARHHQYLTEDVGHPALAQHLYAVIGLMRASHDWRGFKTILDAAFPKKGTQFNLPDLG